MMKMVLISQLTILYKCTCIEKHIRATSPGPHVMEEYVCVCVCVCACVRVRAHVLCVLINLRITRTRLDKVKTEPYRKPDVIT